MGERTIHLGYDVKDGKKLTGYSGRVVRLRDVPTETLERIEITAAQEITAQSTMAELHARIARHAINAMVVGVSEPCEPKDRTTVKMRKLNAEQMAEERNKLFTTKDQIVLKQVYDQMHTVTSKELDAIVGGMIGVVD